MIRLSESPTAARVAAIGLLVGAIVLLGMVVVGPFLVLGRQDAALARADQAIRQATQRITGLQAEPSAPEPQASAAIEAASPALAGGILQQLTRDAIQMSGGTLQSAELLPTRPEGDFIAVPIRLSFDGDSEMLRAFLHQIETSMPVLVVSRLNVAADPSYDAGVTEWKGGIRVIAEVTAWMRADRAS